MVEFPYEIFYLIIEEVEDKLTLKSCALVCRSFVEPSQKNIFRVIDLGDRCITGEVYYRRFYRLISTHPHIANYVRDFRLVDSYVWDRRSDWQWLVKEPTLPLTFQLLPRLQAFSLIFTTGEPAWNSFASHVQAAIFKLLTRRTISSLSLRRIHGVPASLLVHFTRIKHLELYEVEMDPLKASFKDDPGYQRDLRPELRSLTLKSPSSSVVKAIFELLSFSCPSTLENLSIISANEKDEVLRNDLWTLIEWMGSSISRLWWRPRTHPKFPALGPLSPIDLAVLHNLRSLQFLVNFHADDPAVFAQLLFLLGRVASKRNFEQLVIECVFLNPLELAVAKDGWSALDAMLMKEEFSGLRSVIFSAQCKSASMLKTSAMAFLREQLPLSRGKGIAVGFDMNGP